MKDDGLVSRDEMRRLLDRNSLHPELGRPVYEAWSHNTGRCFSSDQLETYLRRCGVLGQPAPQLARWEQQLHSRRFYTQPHGHSRATVLERPVRGSQGLRLVPFNG